MNYQHKYLKYKSKYLEKKYGNRFRLRYKINYNNDDLDYKQKYFKYKLKYLDIKQQFGSGKLIASVASITSSLKNRIKAATSKPKFFWRKHV